MASAVSVINEAEEGMLSAPVTLDGQTEKATGNLFGDVSVYVDYATMRHCRHVETKAYCVEDVIFDNGYLYKGIVAVHVSTLGWPTRRVVKYVEQMLLCSTLSGSRYFGDWLLSDNLLELLSDDLGLEPLKILPHTTYPHLPDLNKLLNRQESYSSDVLCIKRLYLIEDVGYNKSKRDRLNVLRMVLRQNLENAADSGKFVYLLRGDGYESGRGLVNEAEIVDFLRRKNFLIIDPTAHTAKDILDKMLDCSVVVGIEGSQLAYAFLALKKGGLMMTLQPPYHFQSAFRPRCVSVGLNWGFLVGDPVEGGFSIPVEDLDSVLAPYIYGAV